MRILKGLLPAALAAALACLLVFGSAALADGVNYDYSFTLYGQQHTLDDTELYYKDCSIGNKGVSAFYDLIPQMPKLERLVLDDCGIDNEVMSELRDAFPEVSIVWRVHWNSYSTLTDAKMLRGIESISDGSMNNLKYCRDAMFIDFGHSERMSDIEFARYMPNLRVLIVVDSAISSLEPLSACKELEFLEIVNCYNLTDLSPLAECTKLRFLNFSNATKIKDLSPIYGLTGLERLYASRYSIPQEQIDEIKQLLPDCLVSFGMPAESRVSYNYSIGWRLDAAPNERAEWYVELLKIFGIGYDVYDSNGYFSVKNARPYELPLEELTIFGK